MKWLAALFVLGAPAIAQAQTVPDLQLDNPRIQTVQHAEGMSVLLTIMPGSGTTVMLDSGETIQRVTMADNGGYEVRVSPEGNSFLVLAEEFAQPATMQVETDRRSYPFTLRTGQGLTAAYLVRFTYGDGAPAMLAKAAPVAASDQRWSYRLRGDSEVHPADIRDDGARTYITYGPDQPLPAVFAIGPTGDEEMVNGYMRGDVYVIDRVYNELVFRLDKDRARARRNAEPDGEA